MVRTYWQVFPRSQGGASEGDLARRKELVTSALVVIFVVIISTTYIGLIDYAFSRVLQVLIR